MTSEWNRKQNIAIVVFLFTFLQTWAEKLGLEWTHHVVLNKDSSFHLYWTPTENEILFKIEVQTHGYVAVGFSPNGGMKGSDIVVGWIHNSEIYLKDCYAYNNSLPVVDKSQDYKLLGGYENDTHTSIIFSRFWDTCDDQQDMLIGADTVRVIWAFHHEDPRHGRVTYHGHTRRGVRSLYLREAPKETIPKSDIPYLKIWDLKGRNTRLPDDDHTHYWCQIFKAPQLDVKHHMIGFDPIIHPGHESYLHHMVLYECHVGEDDSSADWFERHVSGNGSACYSPNMPPEWSFCLATNAWAWAVGSNGEFLPDHVGMPIGENFGGATYFMLETHYDNPGLHKELVDKSGLRIYYTERLRNHDTAMMLVGSEVNFLHFIPPLQNLFKTVGRCSSDCTEKGFGPEGIHIINGVLHSHLAGRQIRLRHFREGIELPTIFQDNNYDFNFQASRRPHEETHILPGDELMMECVYQTTNRSKPTFGGLSTRDEMCLGFVLYYPRQKLADCRSLPSLKTVMKALGIEEIYGQAFQKLVAFMKDIDGHQRGSDTLQELLAVLAEETGHQLPSVSLAHTQPPLTEEEILKRPFYAVVEENEDLQQGPGLEPPQTHLVTESNYRTLLSDLLLSVRIKSPISLRNSTVGQYVAQMDWSDVELGKSVEDTMVHGSHSCLCLAHGRKPIIPYEEKSFPSITSIYLPKLEPNCQRFQKIQSKKLRKPDDVHITLSLGSNSTFPNLFWVLFVIFLHFHV